MQRYPPYPNSETYAARTSWLVLQAMIQTPGRVRCVLRAYLDHLGIGQPVNGGRIYNGALDNASGSACLLEIARAYSICQSCRAPTSTGVGIRQPKNRHNQTWNFPLADTLKH